MFDRSITVEVVEGGLNVTRRSIISGAETTMLIPGASLEAFDSWKAGKLIQNAMPNVPAELREFIISGITPEEWEGM